MLAAEVSLVSLTPWALELQVLALRVLYVLFSGLRLELGSDAKQGASLTSADPRVEQDSQGTGYRAVKGGPFQQIKNS